jgi:hypothetical protein
MNLQPLLSPNLFVRAGAVFGLAVSGAIIAAVFYLARFEINGSTGSLVRLFVLCLGANMIADMLRRLLVGAVRRLILRYQTELLENAEDAGMEKEDLRVWVDLGGDFEGSWDGLKYVDLRVKGEKKTTVFLSKGVAEKLLTLFPKDTKYK